MESSAAAHATQGSLPNDLARSCPAASDCLSHCVRPPFAMHAGLAFSIAPNPSPARHATLARTAFPVRHLVQPGPPAVFSQYLAQHAHAAFAKFPSTKPLIRQLVRYNILVQAASTVCFLYYRTHLAHAVFDWFPASAPLILQLVVHAIPAQTRLPA